MRWLIIILFLVNMVQAELISINPGTPNAFDLIESAEAGDIVELAPGTYDFRLYLSNNGTPENPIIIRSNPEQRAIFNYSGQDCNLFPGSNSGRIDYWAWQIQGSYIEISDIVITGAHHSAASRSSAAVFMGPETIYAEPTPDSTIPKGITFRNCAFLDNEEGLQGTAEGTLVEFSEIARNGDASSSRPRHNIYLQGGSITVRHSHIHHPTSAQNIHVRTSEALFEYNLIEECKGYMGQLLTNKAQHVNGEDYQQTLTFLGNIIVQTDSQSNPTKLFEIINSNNYNGLSQRINFYYNTFIGNDQGQNIVMLQDMGGTVRQEAYMFNNIFYGYSKPFWSDPTTKPFVMNATNNWWPDGDYSSWLDHMADNHFGNDPGFESMDDFRLRAGSPAIGKGDTSLGLIPVKEFDMLGFRVREDASDLGAFESTTGPEIIGYTDCNDIDCNCIGYENITSSEIVSIITDWISGSATLSDILNIVMQWKSAC